MKGQKRNNMEKLIVEKLTENHYKDVFEIEKTFFDVEDFSSFLSSLKNENLHYFVLKLNSEVVGFFECSIVLDEAELYEIAIKKEFQGKGYSKILMEYFLKFCDENNVRTIFLEVNNTNSKAISLYEKFGFSGYFVRKKYYGENDAILMQYKR